MAPKVSPSPKQTPEVKEIISDKVVKNVIDEAGFVSIKTDDELKSIDVDPRNTDNDMNQVVPVKITFAKEIETDKITIDSEKSEEQSDKVTELIVPGDASTVSNTEALEEDISDTINHKCSEIAMKLDDDAQSKTSETNGYIDEMKNDNSQSNNHKMSCERMEALLVEKAENCSQCDLGEGSLKKKEKVCFFSRPPPGGS